MKTTTILAAGVLVAGIPLAARAVDWQPDAITIKAGVGDSDATMVGTGLRWDWDFWRMRRKSELTAHTELMLNEWHAEKPDRSAYRYYTQVVLLPSLRMRLDRGASPWFLEVGIGLSWMSHKFQTPDKQFGSEWNFYDVLGAGYTFGGPRGKQEADLRLVHFSNAGLKDPNPGLNFVQLRYSREF
jgi:lipid A 3-O-deacylase